MSTMSFDPHNRSMEYLCNEFCKYNFIDPEKSAEYGVKRGLRNPDGTGVLAGLTNICDVVGYDMVNGVRTPTEGKLIYRGIDVKEIIDASIKEDRYIFEEVIWLLLFGKLPTTENLSKFKDIISEYRELPEGFVEDMIIKAPSPNVMNKMGRSVLALYSYDNDCENFAIANQIRQAMVLIAAAPTIMVNAYQIKRRAYDKKSMYVHLPKRELSIAQNILRINRSDKKFSEEEARLLDMCLVLHADHGGGNNSTFTCRVLSSAGSDTYSAISAAIGALKGFRHGGANIKVMEMLEYIKAGVKNYKDDGEITDFLVKLLRGEAGDKSGLIYGIGHAVYTKNDPRATILKEQARALVQERGLEDDFTILDAVDRLAPMIFSAEKNGMNTCANVDLYSGLVYKTLGLPVDLYTPLFAVARMPGWCAHRLEEVSFGKRIMRPAYKYVGTENNYVAIEDRQ